MFVAKKLKIGVSNGNLSYKSFDQKVFSSYIFQQKPYTTILGKAKFNFRKVFKSSSGAPSVKIQKNSEENKDSFYFKITI